VRPQPCLVSTPAALRDATSALLRDARTANGRRPRLGLVPTMGGLHAGHAALAEAARADNDVVVASIFVNPLQFGEQADLERYPRTPGPDVELLGRCGVDIVFAPSEQEVYPDGAPLVRIQAGPLGARWEGAFRPGHFDGMLTVVAKLLHFALPAEDAGYRAYFGQKDVQQLVLIRRMAGDLSFPVDVVGVPTVRDPDGLALSSRNRFLSGGERDAALALYRALQLIKARADAHEPLDVESAAAMVASQRLLTLEYLEVVDPETLEPLAFNCRATPFTGQALALAAVRVGSVRLIDNMLLG
jgi:pantoate--beta-alanine ligase